MQDIILYPLILFGPTVVGIALVSLFAVFVMGPCYDGHGGFDFPWRIKRED